MNGIDFLGRRIRTRSGERASESGHFPLFLQVIPQTFLNPVFPDPIISYEPPCPL